MRGRLLLLLGVFGSLLHGQPGITNLDFPLFDASGRLVRRLTAVSATGSLDVLVLKSGAVEFLGPDGAESAQIGTLTFSEATYRKAAGVIESDGSMQLRFANGTLAAVGFRHELSTGRLFLRSTVVLDFPEAHVTGREGEILLTQAAPDRAMLVSSATISGDVAITGFKPVQEIPADRLETTSATYTGKDSILSPASSISMWAKGKSTGKLNGTINVPVGPASKPGRGNESGSPSPKP